MKRLLCVVTMLVVACGSRVGKPPVATCSAEDVLRSLATAIVNGEDQKVRDLALTSMDLIASHAQDSPDDAAARKDFDFATAQNLASGVHALSEKYRGYEVEDIRPGTIARKVRVEGMDIFVEEMRNSSIILVRKRQKAIVTVATLVQTAGCWKVEHLGTGSLEPAPSRLPGTFERRVRPPEGIGFRRFSGDFCTGAAIFASPDSKSKIGVIVEGYRAYRDPQSKSVFEAVLLRSLMSGHVKGVWMNLEQLATTYIDRSDHALKDCAWSVRDEEVEPLPEETPAAVPKL